MKKQKSKIKISDFLNLPLGQLQDVKNDIELLNDGYEFFYITDTFEIILYYFPFISTIDENITNIDDTQKLRRYEKIAQQGVAYNKFFESILKKDYNQNIIIEGYRKEILRIKEHILSTTVSINDFFQKIFSMLSNEHISREEILNAIKGNFEILLFSLLYIKKDKENNTSEAKRKNLLTFLNNHFVSNFQHEKLLELSRVIDTYVPDEKFIDNIFENYKQNFYSDGRENRIFQKMCSLHKNLSREVVNQLTQQKIEKHFENTEVDIRAIVLTQFLNKFYLKKFPTNKIIFKYLSSAERKNNDIFSNKKNSKNDTSFYQTTIYKLFDFKGLNFKYDFYNFHRNINQEFLTYYLRNESETDLTPQNFLDKLISYRKTTYKLDEILLNDNDIDNRQKIEFHETLLKHTQKLELMVYSHEFINTAKELENDINNKNLGGIFNKIYDVRRYLEDTKLDLISFKNSIELLNKPSYFYGSHLFIVAGVDTIKNPFQHFPLLPFLFDSQGLDAIYNLLNTYFTNSFYYKILDDKDKEYTSYIEIIVKTLNQLENFDNNKSDFLSTYLKLFIFEKSQPNSLNLEEKSKNLNSENEHTFLRVHNNRTNSHIFIKEIRYLHLWFLRRRYRNNDVEDEEKNQENILIFKNWIQLYPEDPRFYHGLGLFLQNHFYHQSRSKLNLDKQLLEDSLSFLEKSIELYNDYLQKYQITATNYLYQIITKNKLAIINSILNLKIDYLYRFEVSNLEINILEDLRRQLNDFKSSCKTNNIPFDNIPTFNLTEIILELLEANYFNSIVWKDRAYQKIQHALKRIENISTQDNNIISDYFNNVFKEVIDLEYKLSLEIIPDYSMY